MTERITGHMLSPINDYVEVSMALSLILEKNYPVECCECDVTLHNSAEGADHEALTGHFDGCYRLGREQAEDLLAIMDAITDACVAAGDVSSGSVDDGMPDGFRLVGARFAKGGVN